MKVSFVNVVSAFVALVSSVSVSAAPYPAPAPTPVVNLSKRDGTPPNTGNTVSLTWTVAQATASPDGTARPSAVLANGQFPGPKVEANYGDMIALTVVNNLPDGTGIHFHGLQFTGVPQYDGAPGVSQCPIPAGGSMTYTFQADRYGTSWWHGHYNMNYLDGLWGPVIIHPPTEAQQYDEEYTITLNDWYHSDGPSIESHFLSQASSGEEQVPDSGLINGVDSYSCAYNNPTQCTANGNITTFNFTPGKKYRLRIINTSVLTNFLFSIDGHNMSVIEADWNDLQPYTTNTMQIAIGQRYSVIVEATQPVGNYWFRAIMDENCYPPSDLTAYPLRNDLRAMISYDGAGSALPNTTSYNASDPNCIDLLETDLVPLQSDNVQSPIQSFVFNVTNTRVTGGYYKGMVNNVSYVNTPQDPTLFHYTSGSSGNTSFPQSQNVYTIPNSGWVQVVLQNLDKDTHPFHLHGHTFSILAYEENATYDPANPPTLNTATPLKRDTATIPIHGYTIISFDASNPGIWLLHCHIEFHYGSGFAVQFAELPSQMASITVPSDMQSMCSA